MTTVDGKRGPRLAEPKPWEAYDRDGNLNLGSYSIGAAMGMVLLANDLLRARAKVVQSEHGGEYVEPEPDAINWLSRQLLDAADQVQISARPDGTVDRLAASHSRARAVVRAALDIHPVPWESTDDEAGAWKAQLVDAAITLMDLAVDLREPDPSIYWRYAGWADQEDHDTFLAMVQERSASLPEQAQAALKIWLADQGWKRPYRRDELDTWARHLDEVEADLEDEIEPTPGDPSDAGAPPPAPSEASTGEDDPSGAPEGGPSVDVGDGDLPDQGAEPAEDGALTDETSGQPACCICPPTCAGLDAEAPDVACNQDCAVCMHGCPAGPDDTCCRDETEETDP